MKDKIATKNKRFIIKPDKENNGLNMLDISNKFKDGGPISDDYQIIFNPTNGADDLYNNNSSSYSNIFLDEGASVDINSLPEESIIEFNPVKYEIPKGNPERLFTHRVNSKVEEKTQKELLDNLISKSTAEIESIQRDLGAKGYFDINLQTGRSKDAKYVQKQLVKEGYLSNSDVDSNIGTQSITALQQMLVDKKYLPEYTEIGESNIDGRLGKRTREAYKQYNRDYNADGILGERTKNAYLTAQDKRVKGFNTYVSAEGMTDQCAKWVSKKFDTITGAAAQNGVFGNAWNMLTNVRDAGGEMLFNIYEDPLFDNASSASDIKVTTNLLLKNYNFDYSKLLEGDIVGIYNPSSTHYSDVLESGTTYNTHVGIVVDVENGIPIIEHNILGKVRRERIDKLTGSLRGTPKVTVAARPKHGEETMQLQFKDVKSKYLDLDIADNPLMNEYMNSLASSKEVFKDIFTDVDLDFIEKAAIAITKRETGFMSNKPSDNKYSPSFIARRVVHNFRDTPEEVKSQDLTKMKFSSLSSAYRASIGLSSPEQLSNDPTITGRAVMLLLAKNYDYFQRLAKENPGLGLSKTDIENATIRSYNRMSYTLGFDEEGYYAPEEIEYLRRSSEIGAKEKDISSTNYKYLGKLGNWMYDTFGDPHTPYVSAARGAMIQLGLIDESEYLEEMLYK